MSIILPTPKVLSRIFKTHNVALASTVAQFAVSLGKGGRISAQGSIADTLKNSQTFAEELETSRKLMDEADEANSPVTGPEPTGGKLMVAEEVEG